VGTVATDEKQALGVELARARGLIEVGEYEVALARLARARRLAWAEREVDALVEIERLTRTVWLQAPATSDIAHRSGQLLLMLGQDQRPSPVTPQRASGFRIAAWLGGLAFLWACIWVLYFINATDPELLWGGNCGPEGDSWLGGRTGNMEGGRYESALTAAVVGGLLWAMAVVAVWRLHRGKGILLLAFPVVYVVALVVLWYGVSPAIWGDPHCVTAQPLGRSRQSRSAGALMALRPGESILVEVVGWRRDH
jgi:hypothetical protein